MDVLGVACEVYRIVEGHGEWDSEEFVVQNSRERYILPIEVRDWYGFTSSCVDILLEHITDEYPTATGGESLSSLNDNGMSFGRLAMLLRHDRVAVGSPREDD